MGRVIPKIERDLRNDVIQLVKEKEALEQELADCNQLHQDAANKLHRQLQKGTIMRDCLYKIAHMKNNVHSSLLNQLPLYIMGLEAAEREALLGLESAK